MGYDLIKSPGLNFGKGRRTLLRSFVPKGKAPDYYHKTRRGLGYVTSPASSEQESDEANFNGHSSGTPSWDSDSSIGNVFRTLSVNMVAVDYLKEDEPDQDEELIQSSNDPWIKHLNTL